MKKQILILSVLLLVFVSCKKENELKKSVFLPDEEEPELPAYSEWGYNTFGAYYDREIFVSNDHLVPAKVIASNNTMIFGFYGQKGMSGSYSGGYNEMVLTFKIAGFGPDQFSNLAMLNDTTFDLKDPSYQVSLKVNGNEFPATILSGSLNFKRAQNLFVDKKQIEVILSGYFEFKALIDDQPVTISDGRFDVGIGVDNFYIN